MSNEPLRNIQTGPNFPAGRECLPREHFGIIDLPERDAKEAISPVPRRNIIGLLGSVYYFLPVSPLIDLVPAITARYDLLSPVEGVTIRTLSFGGEISLTFGL